MILLFKKYCTLIIRNEGLEVTDVPNPLFFFSFFYVDPLLVLDSINKGWEILLQWVHIEKGEKLPYQSTNLLDLVSTYRGIMVNILIWWKIWIWIAELVLLWKGCCWAGGVGGFQRERGRSSSGEPSPGAWTIVATLCECQHRSYPQIPNWLC